MGFFSNVREEIARKRAYNQRFSPEERRQAEMNVRRQELNALKERNMVIKEERDIRTAIAKEKSVIREARAAPFKQTFTRVGGVIKGFKQEAVKTQRQTKNPFTTTSGVGGNLFSQKGSVGNSPFSPENLNKGINIKKEVTKKKKQKNKGVTIIVRR